MTLTNAESKRKMVMTTARELFHALGFSVWNSWSDKLTKKSKEGYKVLNRDSLYGIDGRIIKYSIIPNFEDPEKTWNEQMEEFTTMFNRSMNRRDLPFKAIHYTDYIRIVHEDCPLVEED